MDQSFYPSVDYEKHERLKEEVKKICQKLLANCIDLPGYSSLPEEDRWFVGRDFSHEALWIRTLPDLYVHPAEPPNFFLDVKSKAEPKYQNISIELSSFYWTLRRNMPDLKGIKCAHLYASYDSEGEIRVFSPLLVQISRVIIPQHHWFKGRRIPWTEEEKNLFRSYASYVTKDPKLIQEKTLRAGSGDPFVLIPQRSLKDHMEIHDFLRNHKAREEYIRKSLTTCLP